MEDGPSKRVLSLNHSHAVLTRYQFRVPIRSGVKSIRYKHGWIGGQDKWMITYRSDLAALARVETLRACSHVKGPAHEAHRGKNAHNTQRTCELEAKLLICYDRPTTQSTACVIRRLISTCERLVQPTISHSVKSNFRSSSFNMYLPFSLSLTHGAEPFLRSCQLCSYSRTCQHFIEPEGSLPCS
jgi:hypothetical protein